VLRQILEPSLVISNRYRNFEFELKNDEPVVGMIIKEDTQSVTVQTGASESLVQNLARSNITRQQPKAFSPMPVGLLNTLAKEEIFDLLAWLECGGNPPPHEHAH
jgi:putative heme-binding domain-containing protein